MVTVATSAKSTHKGAAMSSNINKLTRKLSRNLRSLGVTDAKKYTDDGEIWPRFNTLAEAMSGCKDGTRAIEYYKTLAVGNEVIRPIVSDSIERFLSVYRPTILLPIAQDGVIVDIGAGCGLFAVFAALLHPDKQVWAFEADSQLCDIAREAVANLAIKNIELVNKAVVPQDWPTTQNQINVFEDGVFRSLRTKGKQEVALLSVNDLPFGTTTPIALLKLVAPGMFLQLASELVEHSQTLLGEVWKADYGAKDHAMISALLDTVPSGCVRDAESGLLYKTHASRRTTRTKASWSPAIFPAKAEPLNTVIIPVYNIGDLVEPCVESIIKSIDRPTEILVINDGSAQAETLQSLAKVAKMAHTKVIDKPNGGCASARNLGLQIAQGKYVTLIDGDDFVEECFLPLLNEAIYVGASNIAEIGFADYSSITGEVSDNIEPYTDRALRSGMIGYESNMWNILRRQPAIWRRLYRTEWLRQNGLNFPERIKAYDDMEFQFISLYLNGGVSYANARGYYYRKDRPGQDVKASDTRHFGTFQMLVTMENFLRNRRAPRDHFVLFDLFTLDCLSWSYSLIHPQLRTPFLEASRVFMMGGKSFDRAANVHWEISQRINSPDSDFARDFCAEMPDHNALERFHSSAPAYMDHIYDYHFPLEVSS